MKTAEGSGQRASKKDLLLLFFLIACIALIHATGKAKNTGIGTANIMYWTRQL